MSFGGGAGGGSSIAGSSDVALNNPSNSQVLTYNGTLGIWQNQAVPAALVSSVAGKTGAVVLTATDVGLGNVDNTSDLNKPVSTAMQTALNAKANTASLATVATSGSYTDLINKPAIPAAQVNSDWSAATGVAQILNKPSLAAVATSGLYSDLSGKPTLATVATTGSYTDLINKPTVSGTNTGDQTLSIAGTTLTISGASGNSVTLPAGSGSDPYATLGYYNAGLQASTQAQATANSNAIATANTTALQNAVTNCPTGMPIFIPAVATGQAYYFASPITITRSNLSFIGSGTAAISDLSTGSDGGSTLKDIPGFSGAALIIIDNAYHTHFEHVVFVASTAMAAVLDNGNGSIFETCGIVGGSQAAYDARDGTQAPYSLTLNAGSGGHRANMLSCQVVGLSPTAGSYCCYWGVDAVITGGRFNTGTKCMNGSGILLTGAHLTGGSPTLDCQDTRNTVTGCQLDGASDIAMVRINGNLQMSGCLFYQSVSSNPNGAIPMILINGVNGPRINGGVMSSNSGSPAFSTLTSYHSSGNNATTALSGYITDLVGASTGNVTTLWDATGPPGHYSIYNGTSWTTG